MLGHARPAMNHYSHGQNFAHLQVLLPSHELVTEHVTFSTGNSTKDVLAMRTAFAEQWLLGMTDFQVYAQFFCTPSRHLNAHTIELQDVVPK